MNQRIVRLFRRETASTDFIPFIDGLRFLAIAMVVVYHADGFINEKSSGIAFDAATRTDGFNVAVFGYQGVQLFS